MTKAEQNRRNMIADYLTRIRAVKEIYKDEFEHKEEILAKREAARRHRRWESQQRWRDKHQAELQERQKGQR